jgi:hypothetical protein
MAGHKNPGYSSVEEASPGLWYRDVQLVGIAQKGYYAAQRLVARKGRRRWSYMARVLTTHSSMHDIEVYAAYAGAIIEAQSRESRHGRVRRDM